jgi:hypothetical protein
MLDNLLLMSMLSILHADASSSGLKALIMIERVSQKERAGAPVERGRPLGPGRSGFSLHRTGMMAMIHRLRGRIPLTSFPGWLIIVLFTPAPLLEAGESRSFSGLFRALHRS